MVKCLFAFLAIVAAVFESSSAQANCEGRKSCRRCLGGNSDTGCAWHVGESFMGCVTAEDCKSKENEGGKCLFGKDRASNEYICGGACDFRSDSTCEDCLTTDLKGGMGKRSDCAWFVRGNEDPRCIYRKRCHDKGFEGGRCMTGKKFGDNTKKCSRISMDVCPRLKNCQKCLKGKRNQNCAWMVDGETASCVAEDKCEGECHYSSVTFDIRKTCRRLKKPTTTGDEVGIEEECTDLHGLCTDCLKNGCFWVNELKECVVSCEDAAADVGCQGTTPPRESKDLFTRELLRFDSEASMMCYYFKLEDKNNHLCSEQNGNGCEACVNTQLEIALGEYYVIHPTCKYFPEDQFCAPYTCGAFECGTDTCDSKLPPEWPELKGKTSEYAIQYLNDKYGEGTLYIQVIVEGTYYTEDYRLDRVRLFVDKDDGETIIEVPKIG